MSNIVELRQYTLKPGQRETLIELFEREFIETQEAEGMDVIGIFRDLDDPDRFVWLRGFPDMETRARSLAAFYGGPVWKKHRDAANATMIDSDNVLLLRPAWPGSDFADDRRRERTTATGRFIAAAIRYFDAPLTDENIGTIRNALLSNRNAGDTTFIAAFVTEPASNDFPGLPVREGVNAFVWFSPSGKDRPDGMIELPLPAGIKQSNAGEHLRLEPTRRSRLHAP